MSTDLLSSSTEQYPSTVDAPANGDPRTPASVDTPMQSLTNGIVWLRAREEAGLGQVAPIGGSSPIALSVDAVSDTFTCAGHGLSVGDFVQFFAVGGGSLPSPLTSDRLYKVSSVAANTFEIGVNITSAGSGSFYVMKRTSYLHYGPSMKRPVVKLTDASQTIGWDDGDIFACASPGAARTIEVRDGSASNPFPQDGMEIEISRNASGAFAITVTTEAGGTLCTLPSAARATVVIRYTDINDGTGYAWRIVGGFGYTAGADA